MAISFLGRAARKCPFTIRLRITFELTQTLPLMRKRWNPSRQRRQHQRRQNRRRHEIILSLRLPSVVTVKVRGNHAEGRRYQSSSFRTLLDFLTSIRSLTWVIWILWYSRLHRATHFAVALAHVVASGLQSLRASTMERLSLCSALSIHSRWSSSESCLW